MTNEMDTVENSQLKKSMMIEKYFTLNTQMFIMKMKLQSMLSMDLYKIQFLFMIFLIRTYLIISMSFEQILKHTLNHTRMEN